jgi:hypothetical protein
MFVRNQFTLLAALLVLMAGAGMAQISSDLFDKAPPHVDEALRARVTFFYQSHVDGKFRQADTAVHEDSKDAFFVADKNKYRGFEIIKIEYEADFTKARVVTAVDNDFFMPGAGKIPVTIPLTTFWRLDADEWWWFVVPQPDSGTDTPFGKMKAGPEAEDTSSPYYQLQHMQGVNDIGSKIQVNKTDLKLNCSSPATDEVVIKNGMNGFVSLRYAVDDPEGLTAKLDKTDLEAMGEARLTVSCVPTEGLAGKRYSGMIVVNPTNHQIPISITISAK